MATKDKVHLLTSALKQLRDKLHPATFRQINRGMIINVGPIETIYRPTRRALDVKLQERGELLWVCAAHARLFRPH